MVTVRPFSSNQYGHSKLCFALKATNAVTFGSLKSFSSISLGLLSRFLQKGAQKKSMRSFSKSEGHCVCCFQCKAQFAVTVLVRRKWAHRYHHHWALYRYSWPVSWWPDSETNPRAIETGYVHAGWRSTPQSPCIIEAPKGFFKNHLISLNTDHEWAPHSPVLNPLDFLVLGRSKLGRCMPTDLNTSWSQAERGRLCSWSNQRHMAKSEPKFLHDSESMFQQKRVEHVD